MADTVRSKQKERRDEVIVETEPNGFMMVRYKLYFNQQRPDPEDAWVVAYLEEHGLTPRRQLHEEHEGIPYQVWHFGQCYLGRHVAQLGELYQKGVEHSVLAQHIQGLLSEAADDAVRRMVTALETPTRDEVVAQLAAQLYDAARFEAGDEHHVAVHIDAAVVCQAFLTHTAVAPEVTG
jgi:hypothetical protein